MERDAFKRELPSAIYNRAGKGTGRDVLMLFDYRCIAESILSGPLCQSKIVSKERISDLLTRPIDHDVAFSLIRARVISDWMKSYEKNDLFSELQIEIAKRCIRRSKAIITGFLIATFAASIFTIAAPLIFSYAVSHITREETSLALLLTLFLAFSLSIGGARMLQDVKMVLMNHLEQDVRNETNKSTLNKLLKAKGAIFIDNNPSAISALIQNLHQSNTIYIQMFMMVILAGVADIALAFSAIAGKVSWFVAIFVLIYGAISIWVSVESNSTTAQYQKIARAKSIEGANLLGNIVSNVVSIKIFRGQGWVSTLYDRYSTDERSQWKKFYRVRLRYGALQSALIVIQYGCIFSMLLLMLQGEDRLNQIILVSMILMQLNRPFELIGVSLKDFAIAQALATPFQAQLDKHSQPEKARATLPLPADNRLTVALSGLKFSYAGGETPLLDIPRAIFEPGRLNFITGPSGVGKSSLLHILLGINDNYQGSISLSGTPLAALSPEDHLSAIAYVPQDPMLMNFSIRDNVLFGRNFTDGEVEAVLRMVRLDDKLASLEAGLDFVIGERGQLLSGGERQRLTIARALIGKPRILLLDEASSALDEQTEGNIFNALREIADRTTIIAVTHRLKIVTPQDQVLDLSATRAA